MEPLLKLENDTDYENGSVAATDFSNVVLENIKFEKWHFKNISLNQAVFNDVSFKEVVFEDCNLSNLTVEKAYFEKCRFVTCRMTGFKALEANSKMMVFSSFTVEESSNDNYRFDKDKWYDWK